MVEVTIQGDRAVFNVEGLRGGLSRGGATM
jgi:hypothetical protein